MFSVSNVNQSSYVAMHISSVVANWVRAHGVMGSNRGEVKLFFSCSNQVVILHYRPT
jgi:hypothetical protein